MTKIVAIPLGSVGNLELDWINGSLDLSVSVALLPIFQSIRAKSTNTIENAALDVLIGALTATSSPTPPASPAV